MVYELEEQTIYSLIIPAKTTTQVRMNVQMFLFQFSMLCAVQGWCFAIVKFVKYLNGKSVARFFKNTTAMYVATIEYYRQEQKCF